MAEPEDSPLTDRPLNLPGQSVDDKLRDLVDDHFILPLFLCLTLFLITIWEWFAYTTHLPRKPWVFTILSLAALIRAAIYWRIKWPTAMALKLGRNGERAVGQFLDRYSEAVNGRAPDRDPMVQARACASELKKVLKESTGKPFEVQAVVLFPGWFIEDKRQSRNEVWVLEPKALPAWIKNRKPTIEPSDVSLASYHLSRHIRTHPQI